MFSLFARTTTATIESTPSVPLESSPKSTSLFGRVLSIFTPAINVLDEHHPIESLPEVAPSPIDTTPLVRPRRDSTASMQSTTSSLISYATACSFLTPPPSYHSSTSSLSSPTFLARSDVSYALSEPFLADSWVDFDQAYCFTKRADVSISHAQRQLKYVELHYLTSFSELWVVAWRGFSTECARILAEEGAAFGEGLRLGWQES